MSGDPASAAATTASSTASSAPAAEMLAVTKRYRRRTALDGVELRVERGEVFGLLGPNGAGKTTAVKVLLGLTRPSAGQVRLLGEPAGDPRARRRVGYLPELFRYQRWLTGREVLRLHAQLEGIPRAAREEQIEEALAGSDLAGRADDRVAGYSKGMQQRLGMAVALVGRPLLVVLDEPTTALDPLGRHELRGVIRGLRERGTTVILNSHQLSEVEQVCDRVAILQLGKVLAVGRLDMLLARAGVRVRVTGAEQLRSALAVFGEVSVDDPWTVVHGASEAEVPRIVELLVRGGARVYGVEVVHASLEERFRDLVGAPR
ncbi:MAG: ABC transporter ATP-binding protein [Chloroflexota bacterium]|nr:ABC transporter ATP-binding protein [Chloroflexota bacterium]